MRYIKEFDGLRAIAALIVIFHHWSPDFSLLGYIDGVAIFFVLSGFLITTILLSLKLKSEKLNSSKKEVFFNFFMRRALRIIPLYYLIILLKIFHDRYIDIDSLKYYIIFLANYHIYFQQKWGMITHLWSISVEEQFYLFWPVLIFYTSKNQSLLIIISLIIFGIISQIFLSSSVFSNVLTLTCLPSLCIGALIAWFYCYKSNWLLTYNLYPPLTIILSLMIILFAFQIFFFHSMDVRNLSSLLASIIIINILIWDGKYKFYNYILGNNLLVFLGKISYGLYMFHYILPYFTVAYLKKFNNNHFGSLRYYDSSLLFVENFTILICICVVSYFVFEMPILSLKKYFGYTTAQEGRFKKNILKSAYSLIRINKNI